MRHMLLNTEQAIEQLRAGEVIAYPTEAIFGLGCDPRSESAVRKVLVLKHRPESQGLILIGSRYEQFKGWVAAVDEQRLQAALDTWPGPVTWLFPRAPGVPDFVAGTQPTLAIRVSAHETCRALCDAFGGPVVSTSANPHSAPPACSAGEVENYFGSFIGGILAGPLGGREHCSEIRDVRSGEILRPA